MHGESDHPVPIEEAEQMYTALRKQGVPAKMVRYPDSYHGVVGSMAEEEAHLVMEQAPYRGSRSRSSTSQFCTSTNSLGA